MLFRSESLYPKRDGDLLKAKAREKLKPLLKQGLGPAVFEGLERYRQWCDKSATTGTQFVKQMPTWLNNRCWEEDYPDNPQPRNGQKTAVGTYESVLTALERN